MSNVKIKNLEITVDKVSVNVINRYSPILKEISLNIFAEDFIIVLGHNGSGKSTLLKVLSGELKPDKGEIYCKGRAISKIGKEHRSKMMLTLTQKTEDRLFGELTLEENIILWESRYPRAEQYSAKQIIQNAELPENFRQMLQSPVAYLSGGEKQKLLIALMIAHPPQILFLDEHTSALDPKAAEEIMQKTASTITKNKITTIMITHSLDEAIKYGTRLIIMNDGNIVFDKQKIKSYSREELRVLMNGIASS